MTKNVLKLTDFCFSFLIELLNNIVIAIYVLNNLVPKNIHGILQLIFDSDILVIFIPIFVNAITLLYIYHLDESTKEEKFIRIIVGSTIWRMKYQIPSLLLITNTVSVLFICIIMSFNYLFLSKVCLMFIVISMLRLCILLVISCIKA